MPTDPPGLPSPLRCLAQFHRTYSTCDTVRAIIPASPSHHSSQLESSFQAVERLRRGGRSHRGCPTTGPTRRRPVSAVIPLSRRRTVPARCVGGVEASVGSLGAFIECVGGPSRVSKRRSEVSEVSISMEDREGVVGWGVKMTMTRRSRNER